MKRGTRRLSLAIILCSLGASPHCTGMLTVSVVDVPTEPGGYFSATVVGGSAQDTTPNPCYGLTSTGCDLRFFTIDESWYPSNVPQYYNTADPDSWDTPEPVTTYRTIGEWWRAVRNKHRMGRDYLPVDNHVEGPCVVVAAATHATSAPVYLNGSAVSNCARGLVQAASCSIEPVQIEIDLRVAAGQDVPDTAVPGVQVACDSAADVRIESGTLERIPLGGDNTTYAVLDWGRGYGNPLNVHMSAAGRIGVPLRVKTVGVSRVDAGIISGSSVVNVTYE